MNNFVTREIHDKVTNLKADIARNNNDPRLINKLGVLYARFGLYDKAETEFRKAAAKNKYVPALLNLGNIQYLNGKMKDARNHYKIVIDISPDNAYALLGFARSSFELDDYPSVVSAFKK